MTLQQFVEQDKYCRENNTPEGSGCTNCPAQDKEHCADALRNLAGKLIDSIDTPQFMGVSREMERDYGLTPYNQLVIFKGILEFPQ